MKDSRHSLSYGLACSLLEDHPQRSLSYSLARSQLEETPGLFRHPFFLALAATACFTLAHFCGSLRYLVIVGGLLLVQAIFEWRLRGIRELMREQEEELAELREQLPQVPLRTEPPCPVRHETTVSA